MNKELLQKAIDHIEQPDVELGSCGLFYAGKPYCALGHMAFVVGINGYPDKVYAAIGKAYDLTPEKVERVYMTNDGTPGDTRKKEVLDLLKCWLAEDPA